jgi:hypothetical protein
MGGDNTHAACLVEAEIAKKGRISLDLYLSFRSVRVA